MPLPELYRYMRQERPDGQFYPNPPLRSSRSQTIVEVLAPFISKESSLLEIGCNLGRNLNHLKQAGYGQLYGMEISEHAVGRLRRAYPSLSEVRIDVGPAEVLIKQWASGSVNVIFSMASLEQIHPESGYLFKEMARVARDYVLAIEPRHGKWSHMQYPWNIRREFIAAGLTLIQVTPWASLWPGELSPENEWTDDLHEYDAFLFKSHKADP